MNPRVLGQVDKLLKSILGTHVKALASKSNGKAGRTKHMEDLIGRLKGSHPFTNLLCTAFKSVSGGASADTIKQALLLCDVSRENTKATKLRLQNKVQESTRLIDNLNHKKHTLCFNKKKAEKALENMKFVKIWTQSDQDQSNTIYEFWDPENVKELTGVDLTDHDSWRKTIYSLEQYFDPNSLDDRLKEDFQIGEAQDGTVGSLVGMFQKKVTIADSQSRNLATYSASPPSGDGTGSAFTIGSCDLNRDMAEISRDLLAGAASATAAAADGGAVPSSVACHSFPDDSAKSTISAGTWGEEEQAVASSVAGHYCSGDVGSTISAVTLDEGFYVEKQKPILAAKPSLAMDPTPSRGRDQTARLTLECNRCLAKYIDDTRKANGKTMLETYEQLIIDARGGGASIYDRVTKMPEFSHLKGHLAQTASNDLKKQRRAFNNATRNFRTWCKSSPQQAASAPPAAAATASLNVHASSEATPT